MTVRASVLIPTHDQPTTLPLTVDSVLNQTVAEVEVLLIGDGVSPVAREVIEGLVAADERVRFLDFPKGPHHGERYRHDAVVAARSDAIFYLCDDDLLLPDHVADLLALLEDHTFVQSLNGYVTVAGRVWLFATDLADPDAVALHLREDVRYNAVSITGTAHSRRFYDEVGRRWDTTPTGAWPDHHQWRKLMAHPGFRGATSSRMTALQFPTSVDGRDAWSPTERHAEIEPWHRLVRAGTAQETVDRMVTEAAVAQLAVAVRTGLVLSQDRDAAWRSVEAARGELTAAQDLAAEQLRSATEAHARLGEALDAAEGYRVGLVAAREQVARLQGTVRRLRATRPS